MKLVLALKRFVYPVSADPLIDCTRIEPDPALVERNQRERDRCINEVLPKTAKGWILHNPNPPAQQPAANDEAANESDRTH